MAESDREFERKSLYSILEVATITGRPLGLIKRWVYRGQLASVRVEDEIVFVPFDALVDRLERLEWRRRRHEAKARQMKGDAAID